MKGDQEFFREALLDHSRNPRNVGRLENPSASAAISNPLCGDQISVAILTRGDEIHELKFEIRACAICTASASLMSLVIKGLSISQAFELLKTFEQNLFEQPECPWPEELKILRPFSHVRVNRSRIPCVFLPWQAFDKALFKTA